MRKSEILLSPKKDSLSAVGDGARVLDATLMKLPELSVRRKLRGARDGDSKGMMDTRPAMSDTR
jgi:hypothetical protein